MVHSLPLAELEYVSNELEAIEDFQNHECGVTSVHLEICLANVLCYLVFNLNIKIHFHKQYLHYILTIYTVPSLGVRDDPPPEEFELKASPIKIASTGIK